MRLMGGFASFLLGLSIAGCSDIEVLKSPYKNGLDGNVTPDQIEKSFELQETIFKGLAKLNEESLGTKDYYYNVTVSGLNFIDEQCDAYMRELYLIDRVRDRTKSALNATGVITQAILGAVPASKASVTIVGQAFGLSGEMVDTFANSYLFQNHAAEVVTIVETMQAAYRQQLDQNQLKPETRITTRAGAYATIRGYFRLCMPQTIEARVTQGLQKLSASPVATGGANGGILVMISPVAQSAATADKPVAKQ